MNNEGESDTSGRTDKPEDLVGFRDRRSFKWNRSIYGRDLNTRDFRTVVWKAPYNVRIRKIRGILDVKSYPGVDTDLRVYICLLKKPKNTLPTLIDLSRNLSSQPGVSIFNPTNDSNHQLASYTVALISNDQIGLEQKYVLYAPKVGMMNADDEIEICMQIYRSGREGVAPPAPSDIKTESMETTTTASISDNPMGLPFQETDKGKSKVDTGQSEADKEKIAQIYISATLDER